MRSIEVCFSPELIHLHEVTGKLVVVVDIFRATSTMVAALAHGVTEIMPFADLEACRAMQSQGYLIAAERDGLTAPGFELGNSPVAYTSGAYAGRKLAMTTTNGTHALSLCQMAKSVYVGAFLNCAVTCDALMNEEGDIYLLCSGWKGFFNLEDTLLAGAMAASLSQMGVKVADDATRAAIRLWNQAKTDVAGFLSDANHVQRFQSMHAESDLDVCLKIDTSKKVVYYVGGELVTERP